MNSLTIQWLSPYIVPFFALSYPTVAPKNPDSFPDSAYYNTGVQDVCLVITCIAVMAILRDALRLGVLEPLAHWKLTRDLYNRKRKSKEHANGHVTTNGVSNGNNHVFDDSKPTPKELRKVHRSVLRFAEQGWSVVYYTFQWSYGLVRRDRSYCRGSI